MKPLKKISRGAGEPKAASRHSGSVTFRVRLRGSPPLRNSSGTANLGCQDLGLHGPGSAKFGAACTIAPPRSSRKNRARMWADVRAELKTADFGTCPITKFTYSPASVAAPAPVHPSSQERPLHGSTSCTAIAARPRPCHRVCRRAWPPCRRSCHRPSCRRHPCRRPSFPRSSAWFSP